MTIKALLRGEESVILALNWCAEGREELCIVVPRRVPRVPLFHPVPIMYRVGRISIRRALHQPVTVDAGDEGTDEGEEGGQPGAGLQSSRLA